MRCTHQSRPPPASIHSTWSASSSRVATRGRVVGLVLARVLERGLQREEGRLPATGGAVELLDPLDRRRAEQRQPEAAVGAEGLLRGEVVGVGLGGIERQATGARGAVDQDQRVAGALGAAGHRPSPRSRSRCAPRRSRRRRGRRPARARRPGSASTTIGSSRKGAAGGHLGELLRELAVGEVEGAVTHQPGGGGVPEGGRAAVAERHLVAVGQPEQLTEPGADARRPDRARAPGDARCPSRSARSASAASASGRTFEGPQPKRPSAGLRSAGIWTEVEVGIGRPRLLTRAGGPHRRARVRCGR